jgi:N-acyl-D-aspartate/D-glutamate deacylase
MSSRKFSFGFVLLVFALGLFGFQSLFSAEQYDVIIKNTKIVDGTGRLGYVGDVAIKGERIVAVGKVIGTAITIIDGAGLVTAPGFLEVHSGAETGILRYPLADNYIMQGITTVLTSYCGHGAVPSKGLTHGAFGDLGGGPGAEGMTTAEWMVKVEKAGTALNLAHITPLTDNVRGIVMGGDFKRPATPAEIEKMKSIVEEDMKSGSWGISIGLDPGRRQYASREEVIECAKIAQKYGGILHPHTRNHQNNWFTEDPQELGYGFLYQPKGEVMTGRYHGLLEQVEMAYEANNITLMFGHFTPAYVIPQPHPEWLQGAVAQATIDEIIDKPWKRGQRVYFNMEPCDFGVGWLQPMITPLLGAAKRSSNLKLPSWWTDLTKDQLIEKLKSKEFRKKAKDEIIFSGKFKFEMIHPVTDPYWMDCYKIINCKNKKYEGKTIGELARERSPNNIMKAVYEDSLEVMFDILVEDPDTNWALILDKREITGGLPVFFKDRRAMPIIDHGIAPAQLEKGKEIPAPMQYGMVPYYIDTYVKKLGVLTLEEAINRTSFLPAQEVLNMKDRGLIALGAYADLVVFNLDEIAMGGITGVPDYEHPNVPPNGIRYVFVNGKLTFKDKAFTGVKAGKVLRKNAQN